MVDAGEGRVQADEVVGQLPHAAGKPLCGLEHAGEHLVAERGVPGESVTVFLIPGIRLRPFTVGRVLLVARDDAVQGEAGGLLTDLDFRIALHELLAESGHAEDATAGKRGDGKYVAPLPEYFREALVHGAGNLLVLLPAQFRQLADAGHQFLLRVEEASVESLTFAGQELFLVGVFQQGVQLVV